MSWIVNRIAKAGDWLISLSDAAKKQLVLLLLLGLGSGAVYKLVSSVNRLSEPLPQASPDQLLIPMKQLYNRTHGQLDAYQRGHQKDQLEMDSLRKMLSTKRL